MVSPERLRFDFAHPKPISADELRRVEDIANDVMLQNGEVTTRLMAVDDARAAGARALFGEKYGDEVRVVSMGAGGGNTLGWSVELCGGTHVKRLGDIGMISVMGESAVASGVRRIEALTGNVARHAANASIQTAKAAAAELRTSLDDMPARVAALVEERRKLERDLADARKKLAMGGGASAGGGAASDIRTIGDIKFLGRAVQDIEMKDLKSLADDGKKQLGSGVVAHRRRHRGRQGRHRRRRDRRPDVALQRRRARAHGLRGAWRQGRRRPSRHGAGRRPGRLEGERGARGDLRGAGVVSRAAVLNRRACRHRRCVAAAARASPACPAQVV